MKNISIIIPTLNEEKNVLPLLEKISAAMVTAAIEAEIIIVDDGSTDGTRQTVMDYTGRMNVRLICRDNERGLASAVVAGAKVASSEIIVVMDADLSHPPEVIPSLLTPLFADTHDMVIGSRYVDGGETPDWPMIRKIGSRIASIPAQLLTSVHDPLAGFFAVRRNLLTCVKGDTVGFKIGFEILATSQKKLRVKEVPISFTDRYMGISKMNHTILSSYIRQLCRFGIDLLSKEQIPFLVLLGLLAVLFDFAALSVFNDHGYPMEMTHLVSLFLGLHVSYMLFIPFCRKPLKYVHFLVVVLLCSFIRGGILSWFLLPNEASLPELPLLTIFATAGVTWLAAILICTRNVSRTSIQGPAFPVFFILYTILLRLVYLGSPELIQEEAYYWNYSQHMAAGYLDHPPVVALLIKIGTSLFGHNEFGVRIGAFACWFITAFFSYRLTKRVFNKEAGLRAVLLIATLPIFFFVGMVTTPDAPLIASWSGAVYFLHRALVGNHSRSWYGAGICLGIGLASKYTIAFLAPAIVLFMLLDANARKWFFRPQPYLAALLGLSIFSPVIWWNYQHDWASFLFQSQRRIQDSGGFSTHELLGSILVLITPTGLIAAIAAMRPKFVRRIAPDFVSSFAKNGTYLFSFIMAVVPLSIFIFFSMTKEIKLNWTGPLWLSILPFMAVAMVHYRGTLQGKLNTIWPGTIVVSTLLFGCLLHYMSIGIPGIPFTQKDFLFGFDNVALQVRKELAKNTRPTGTEPILVGADKYRIASGLAFYRRKNMLADAVTFHNDDTTSRQLLGHDALMYNYWMPPANSEDRDLLVISEKTSNLKPDSFAENDPRLGEIHSFTAMKHGRTAGTFYYRLISHHVETGHESDTVTNFQQDSRDTNNRAASSLL